MNEDRVDNSGPESSLVQNSKIDLKSHWDDTYNKIPIEKLGWYEDSSNPSLDLIEYCNLDKSAAILNVGAGASTIIDALLERGYKNIIVNDISSIALKKLIERLEDKSWKVKWIEDDLTKPRRLNKIDKIDLWHDRAVLHFFISQEDQLAYFNLVKEKVVKGGYVIIAVFNLDGATKCSGLPVYRYSEEMLISKLGKEFELLESFNYIYSMPSGNIRPYIYTLFKRN